MADIKAGLYAYLLTKTTLTDLIGASDSAKLYADEVSQGDSLPYINYDIDDEDRPTHLRGACEYCDSMFTFTVHGSTPDERHEVSEALRNLLHMQTNLNLDNGLNVRVIRLKHRRDSKLPPPDGSEQAQYICEMDFDVVWQEPLPTTNADENALLNDDGDPVLNDDGDPVLVEE